MKNQVVLKSIFAENYGSFADRIEFTTAADVNKKEFLENTFTIGDNAFNKTSFIYGGNGSGKSFFCKILREIQRLISWSPLSFSNSKELLSLPPFKDMDKPVKAFAFDPVYKEKPTVLGLEIVLDEITYHYEFSILGKEIQTELLTKKYRRTEKLISRKGPSFKNIVLRSDLKPFENNVSVVKEEALCLSMADFLNNPLAKKLVDAIQSIDVLNMTNNRSVPPGEFEMSFSPERIQKYEAVLRHADPTLRKMNVSLREEEKSHHPIELNNFENREFTLVRRTIDIKVEHAVFENGVECSTGQALDFFNDESLGTVKLFTTLPYLYNALEFGGVIVLDEIENGLHPTLVKEIIQLFNSPESNPNNAQLICTSHQPLLVGPNMQIRRDQVWIVCKDQFGKSSLRRVSNSKDAHNKVNLSTKILEGAFGCKPEIFFKK